MNLRRQCIDIFIFGVLTAYKDIDGIPVCENCVWSPYQIDYGMENVDNHYNWIAQRCKVHQTYVKPGRNWNPKGWSTAD